MIQMFFFLLFRTITRAQSFLTDKRTLLRSSFSHPRQSNKSPPPGNLVGFLYLLPIYVNQDCQFCSVSLRMAETFHTNSKNKTKRNNFHLILNLGPFRIFWLNFSQNVPISFHMFHSALKKPLNQIEPYSI
jgi:hypothetical protein